MNGSDTPDREEWERKLDHRLKATIDRVGSDPAQASRTVSVFVRFRGDVSNLRALGLQVRTVAGDIATASLRLADVEEAARSDSVSFIELGGLTHLDD